MESIAKLTVSMQAMYNRVKANEDAICHNTPLHSYLIWSWCCMGTYIYSYMLLATNNIVTNSALLQLQYVSFRARVYLFCWTFTGTAASQSQTVSNWRNGQVEKEVSHDLQFFQLLYAHMHTYSHRMHAQCTSLLINHKLEGQQINCYKLLSTLSNILKCVTAKCKACKLQHDWTHPV